MSSLEILIVEDDQATREMLAFALRRAGFMPQMAADAQSAQQHLATQRPHLILIDWMLPDRSGIELIRSIRSQPAIRELPLILVTARATEADKVAGLDCGADDYVTKPFSPRELVARVQALLRRSDEDDDDRPLELEGLRLDPGSHRVSVGDGPLEVGPTEFRLLEFFMRNPERVHSRDLILDRVWGTSVYIEVRTVDVHIRRLRRTLKTARLEHLIQTVRGAGYRFSNRPGGTPAKTRGELINID